MTNFKRLAAENGSFVQDSATSSGDVTDALEGFESISDDTVIDRIEINGDDSTNVLTTYVKTSGGAMLFGAKVYAGGEDYFSLVSMTAGALNCVKA